jgi:phosphinothricin acetyltransferase
MKYCRPEDPSMELRDAQPDDASAIAGIYNHYVRETVVSMEFEPVAPQEMATRIAGVQNAGPWRARIGYRHAVETSVYLDPAACGRGIGSRLYLALLGSLRAAGYHAVIGGIALPNPGCVALHEKFGFVPVARFREVGRKFDEWVDVGYWQLLLTPEGAAK